MNALLTKPKVHDNNTNYTNFQLSLFNKLIEYSISSISKLKLAIITLSMLIKATNNFLRRSNMKLPFCPFGDLTDFCL